MRGRFVRSGGLGLRAREQLGYLDERYRVQNYGCHFLEVILEHGYRICKTRNKWIIHKYRVFMEMEISENYVLRISCKNYMGLQDRPWPLPSEGSNFWWKSMKHRHFDQPGGLWVRPQDPCLKFGEPKPGNQSQSRFKSESRGSGTLESTKAEKLKSNYRIRSSNPPYDFFLDLVSHGNEIRVLNSGLTRF
jgi:hypothetical protein